MKISTVIITKEIDSQLNELLSQLEKEKLCNEIVVVHEDKEAIKINNSKINYIKIPKNKGKGFARKIGAEIAKGDIINFIDSDEKLINSNYFKILLDEFRNKKTVVVAGGVVIPKKNYFTSAVSYLGYPSGGNLGFENMWLVDKNKFTNHLSACNCAFRKKILLEVGNFNPDLKIGAEDTLISLKFAEQGYKIKYNPKLKLEHAPIFLYKFLKWQLERTKAAKDLINLLNKKQKKELYKLRLWQIKNIILQNIFRKEFPLVLCLLGINLLLNLCFMLKIKLIKITWF